MYTYGRIQQFDERSWQYPVRALAAGLKPKSVHWPCGIVLNQGNVGACIGFSIAHEAAAEPVAVKRITNKVGLYVYRQAQKLDNIPGEAYDGSTVLAGMKAGVQLGWYTGYHWAFGEDDVALALQIGPVVLGINWYEDMNYPDKHGRITKTGELMGGHAILCNGFDSRRGLYRLHNSWGKSWGLNGECFISQVGLRLLLREHGEAAVPIGRKKG